MEKFQVMHHFLLGDLGIYSRDKLPEFNNSPYLVWVDEERQDVIR
jgi:hypothetical protein